MRVIKLLIIYLILIIYSLEILIFLFIPSEQKNMVDIKNTRIKLAKEKNIDYDVRSPEQIYVDLKNKNENIKPGFLYAQHFSNLKIFKEAKTNNKIIPFRGPINSLTVSCAEDLQYKLIKNDKYGFKNDNSIYQKKIKNFLLGDSYAEGLCENNKNDIAGHLNEKKIYTINFGVTGTGPLISLGILREFGNYFKPKNVIYLYFEGNDLDELNYEKKDTTLIKYLNDNYNQDYLNNYDDINYFLIKSEQETEKIIYLKSKNTFLPNKKNKFDILKAHLKDILEINNLRNIFKYKILKKQKGFYDLNLLYKTVEKMNDDTKKWDGNYTFVYVPTWSRYFTKYTKYDAKIDLKEEIIKNLNSKNIKVLDLTDYFNQIENIEQYYPLGFLGHYNSKGYEKIAEIIEKSLD